MTEGGSGLPGAYPTTHPDAWRANDRNMESRATANSIDLKKEELRKRLNEKVDALQTELVNELQSKGYSEKFATIRLADIDSEKGQEYLRKTLRHAVERDNPMFDSLLQHPISGEEEKKENDLTEKIEHRWVELYRTPQEVKLGKQLEKDVDKRYRQEMKNMHRQGLTLSNFYPGVHEEYERRQQQEATQPIRVTGESLPFRDPVLEEEAIRVDLFKDKLRREIIQKNKRYNGLRVVLTEAELHEQDLIEQYDHSVRMWDRALEHTLNGNTSAEDQSRVRQTREFMDQQKAKLRTYYETNNPSEPYEVEMVSIDVARLDQKYGHLTPQEIRDIATVSLEDAEAFLSMKRANKGTIPRRPIPLPSSLPQHQLDPSQMQETQPMDALHSTQPSVDSLKRRAQPIPADVTRPYTVEPDTTASAPDTDKPVVPSSRRPLTDDDFNYTDEEKAAMSAPIDRFSPYNSAFPDPETIPQVPEPLFTFSIPVDAQKKDDTAQAGSVPKMEDTTVSSADAPHADESKTVAQVAASIPGKQPDTLSSDVSRDEQDTAFRSPNELLRDVQGIQMKLQQLQSLMNTNPSQEDRDEYRTLSDAARRIQNEIFDSQNTNGNIYHYDTDVQHLKEKADAYLSKHQDLE